ncbi:hypothetical protein JX265_004174 [Neoarthrinium moseri]|uniref:CBM-cenC domain-containing protein n=1 Tax=Neoarthrinium moseri TaxID=1658444 RepID=A0A9P9WRM7_9PEZI|nr:hypothetical protein JX265_004174 [Neoarthrinium moseri]
MHTSLFTSGLWLSLVAAKPCSDKTKDEKTILSTYDIPSTSGSINLTSSPTHESISRPGSLGPSSIKAPKAPSSSATVGPTSIPTYQTPSSSSNVEPTSLSSSATTLLNSTIIILLSIFDKADILFVNSFGIYQHRVISLYPPNYTRNFSIDVTIEHRYNYLNFSVYDDLHLKHNLSIPVRIHPKLTNVVQNPGFEDAGGSLSPWQAGIAIDGDGPDDLAFTGLAQPGSNSSNAVLLHADGPLGGGVISAFVYQTVPTVAGTIYRISYDIAISIAQPNNFYSCFFSGYHDWEAFDSFTLENTQGYRRYTAFFGAAADNQVLKFVVECDSYRGSAEIEIDNVYAVAVE